MKQQKDILKGLKPERVWFYFGQIMQIPRPSKHEERISAWLVNWGKEHGLETLSDHLETQALWQQSSANLVNARCQLQLARTKLLKASGQL